MVIHQFLGVPIAGSFWLFMLGVLINLFTVTSLGIFLACFARDMPQLGILLILVLMPMQILSGGTTSQENMPEVIQFIMRFAPTTYFVEFGKAILFRGANFALVWKTFLPGVLRGRWECVNAGCPRRVQCTAEGRRNRIRVPSRR